MSSAQSLSYQTQFTNIRPNTTWLTCIRIGTDHTAFPEIQSFAVSLV